MFGSLLLYFLVIYIKCLCSVMSIHYIQGVCTSYVNVNQCIVAKKVEKNPEVIEEVVPPLNAPQPSELTTEKLLKQVQVTTHTTTSPPKNKKKKAEQNVLAMIG